MTLVQTICIDFVPTICDCVLEKHLSRLACSPYSSNLFKTRAMFSKLCFQPIQLCLQFLANSIGNGPCLVKLRNSVLIQGYLPLDMLQSSYSWLKRHSSPIQHCFQFLLSARWHRTCDLQTFYGFPVQLQLPQPVMSPKCWSLYSYYVQIQLTLLIIVPYSHGHHL